jgi:sugar-specific transcriptional regulator TrmB
MKQITPELSALEDLGLSMNESKVYLTLLELGDSGAGKIAQKSKIHRTNVYDALQKLVEKGLVFYFTKNDTKTYQAADPEHLSNLIQQKERRLNSIMPKLNLLKDLSESQRRSVTIAEGMVAVRNSMLGHLKWNEPIYTIGSPAVAAALSMPFLTQFHKKRIEQGVPMIHIYNMDSLERARVMNQMKLTQARVLPKEFNSLISTGICGEEVTFRIWGDNAIVIKIKCKELAEAYLSYHKMLWEISVEP